MIDRPQIAASETVEVRNLSQRAQDASVVGRRKVHLLVLPHDPIDVDRCEPFIFEQPAQAAPKERCVVADGGAARPHHQEGQERSLAGENDALPPLDPYQIRKPIPQQGRLRQLRRRGNLGTDLREEFPGATDQRHDDCPR